MPVTFVSVKLLGDLYLSNWYILIGKKCSIRIMVFVYKWGLSVILVYTFTINGSLQQQQN